MADEVFRPKKPSIQDIDNAQVAEGHPLYGVQKMQRMAAEDHRYAAADLGQEAPQQATPQHASQVGESAALGVEGNVPQAFLEAIQRQRAAVASGPPDDAYAEEEAPRAKAKPRSQPQAQPRTMPMPGQQQNDGVLNNNPQLLEIMRRLETGQGDGARGTHHYDEITLPSLGKFYDGTDGPINGVLHVRQMTGEEEEILAQPRYIKKGKAIDMIFEKCVREPIRADRLLGIDRTFMLVYLRGISYTPYYEVEIKCPECSNRFQTTIDLNTLEVDTCPETFDSECLSGVLPSSGLRFSYRLACGADETMVQLYREKMNKEYGDQRADDTMAYRTSLLLEEIEGIRDKIQIKLIAKKLPISDLNYIRNLVNEPPFGVNTEIELNCPVCLQEFQIDLPFDSGFFFPRRKKSAPTT